MQFVPGAFHPAHKPRTLFGRAVTAQTYKTVLYDYDGHIYRPSGLGADHPEMRATYRCVRCGTRRTWVGGRHPWSYPWPAGSNGCHHQFRLTGVEVLVLRADGTKTWRRPWLLRSGERVYTNTVRLHESGWGMPKGSLRIALCRRPQPTNSSGNPNAARALPLSTMRQLYGRSFGEFLAKV